MHRGCGICSFSKVSWKQNRDCLVSLVLVEQVRKIEIIPDTWEYKAGSDMRTIC